MSKSIGNCIYLSDSEKEVHDKIFSMFTDPGHLKASDPGKIEGNTVFTYLDAFAVPEDFAKFNSPYPNLDEMKAHYQRGGLGDVAVKKFLNEVMQQILSPIRTRRQQYEQDIPFVIDVLKKGTEKAYDKAAKTLEKVRRAMKLNHFEAGLKLQSK